MNKMWRNCCFLMALAASSVMVSGQSNTDWVDSEVTVQRDERSVLYIGAKQEKDLYFAQGFETARDRLWQMDLLRRVARGRLAELFGNTVLEQDKMWRRYDFSNTAEKSLKLMDPGLRSALENYARGVNAYIKTIDLKSAPVEFQILSYMPEPWQPSDSIVIGKILAEGLSSTWEQDLEYVALEKLPKEKFEAITSVRTPEDMILFGSDAVTPKKNLSGVRVQPLPTGIAEEDNEGFIARNREIRKASLETVGFYAEELAASNNWVITGTRTLGGSPILANDPHLPANAPGVWYLTHLATPEIRVAGVTVPGVPGVILGHNQFIAWGATNVGPDVQDLYIEEFNGSGEYKTGLGYKKPSIRKEEILVRTNPTSPKTTPIPFEVIETQNGVLIKQSEQGSIALKWTAMDPNNQEFEAFYFLNRAKNWKEFNEALKRYGGATQNFVFADKEGNTGWHVAGKIPIRRVGTGIRPYLGASGDGDWVGWIGYDELPNAFVTKKGLQTKGASESLKTDPGMIITANQRIAGLDYKYQQITRQFAPPWRAREIKRKLSSFSSISLDDVSAAQFDSYNIPLANFAKTIVKRKAADQKLLTIIEEWNGKMTADSIGATVVDAIDLCMGEEIAAENAPAKAGVFRSRILPFAIPANDTLFLPKKYNGWTEFITSCSGKAAVNLDKKFGADSANWKWGKARPVVFRHPLAQIPLIGKMFTVEYTNVDGSGLSPNVGANVSMRFVATPMDWDVTKHGIPLGQSGSPISPHWNDQFESWRTGKTPVFPFSPEAVKNAMLDEIIMKPSNR